MQQRTLTVVPFKCPPERKDQLKYSEPQGADGEEPGVEGPECVPLIPRPSSYTEDTICYVNVK